MNSTTLELIRGKNTKAAGHTGSIVGLLKTLGVPRQMLYVRRLRENGSFWLRDINHLQIMEQAHSLSRKQFVCVHPDQAGGCLEQTIQFNWTWGEFARRFKKHGHELW